jgi:hypothetical protein
MTVATQLLRVAMRTPLGKLRGVSLSGKSSVVPLVATRRSMRVWAALLASAKTILPFAAVALTTMAVTVTDEPADRSSLADEYCVSTYQDPAFFVLAM